MSQKKHVKWAVDTFGSIAIDKQERIKRFAEESIELCQACGLNYRYLKNIIDDVYYKKDIGDINQELGQVELCLSMLAEVYDLNANVEMACEFDRVSSFDKSYWQARQNRKHELGLGGKCDG